MASLAFAISAARRAWPSGVQFAALRALTILHHALNVIFFSAANGVLDPYVGKEVRFGIRPEHVHDEPEFLEKNTDNIIKAEVVVTELMGAEIYLYVNIGGTQVTARVEPTSTAKPGDVIDIAFDLDKIHIFDKDTEMTITN